MTSVIKLRNNKVHIVIFEECEHKEESKKCICLILMQMKYLNLTKFAAVKSIAKKSLPAKEKEIYFSKLSISK